MTDQRIGGKLFIYVLAFTSVVAVVCAISATGLSVYIDSRPDGYAPMTSASVARLWTIAFSSFSFLLGLGGGKVI